MKEEERKKVEGDKSSPEKDRLKSSGISSKGTQSPSHRPSKHSDPLKRSTSATSLKRSGSPLNSEASGNESARKKQKKKHLTASQPSTLSGNTLQPPSRPDSPPYQQATSSTSQLGISRKAKRPRGPGSGSDTEGGAGSGGEMSDGARKKLKLKLGPPSRNGTPQGSRGASPEVPNAVAVNTTQSISRPGSPGNQDSQSSSVNELNVLLAKAPVIDTRPPTANEIRALVPTSGIEMKELLAHFKGRYESGEQKPRFMGLLKANTRLEKGVGKANLLFPIETKIKKEGE